jgi:hypothetical protein
MAAVAFAGGCGGDSETTTVAGRATTTTVTDTVTVHAGPKAGAKQGSRAAREANRRPNRGRPEVVRPSRRGPGRFGQQGGAHQFPLLAQNGRPVMRCFRRFGGFQGGGSQPRSPDAARKARERIRECVQRLQR